MAEVTVLTLTDFLLARIADDEAAIRHSDIDYFPSYAGEVAPAGHPARVLAECEAKRRIMALHDNPCPDCLAARRCIPHDSSAGGVGAVRYRDPVDTLTLAALAAIYADHPDYREEWR